MKRPQCHSVKDVCGDSGDVSKVEGGVSDCGATKATHAPTARRPRSTAGKQDKTSGGIGDDAQHWSDEPMKQMVLPTRTRRDLLVLCTDLAVEGCVKHLGPDTRPRLQAGAVCAYAGGKPQGQKLEIVTPRNGSGEWKG